MINIYKSLHGLDKQALITDAEAFLTDISPQNTPAARNLKLWRESTMRSFNGRFLV